MEEIKNRSGKRYRESIYINGKKVHSPTFKRKSDAKAWKANQDQERAISQSRGFQIQNMITVKDLSLLWQINNMGKSIRTISAYESFLKNHILPVMGHITLKNIRPHHGNVFKQKLLEKGLATTTVNNGFRALKALFNFGVENENLMKSPFTKLKLLPNSKTGLNYWNPHEVKRFLDANSEDHYYSLYLTALLTGLRKAELCGLCWDCIDLDSRRITVRRTRDRYGLKETTKNKSSRIIPMHKKVFETLNDLRRKRKSFHYVFTKEDGETGAPYEHLQSRHFAKAIERSGVKKIRFHDLRTSFASNFVNFGGNIYSLKEILGHKSIEVTQKCYAQLTPNFLLEEMNNVNFLPEFSDTDSERLRVLDLDRPNIDQSSL